MSYPNDIYNGMALQEKDTFDQKLDLLVDETGAVSQIATEIGNRLDDSTMHLQDIGRKMDTVQNKLDHAIDGMKEITASSNGCLILVSIILTVVLLFLFVYIFL